MVILQIMGHRASISNQEISCDTDYVCKMIEASRPFFIPSSEPNPDRVMAEAAVKEWGGKILHDDRIPYRATGRVY